jgi:type II secretory pathway pseudopilin PulG
MNKFLLFKLDKKVSQKEAGFSTFEILISLIIALLFVAVAMQSLVYAMAMKVQAQEKQRANELIQEDVERLNQLGSTLPTPPVPDTCNPGDVPSVAYQNGYARLLWNFLQTEAPSAPTTTSVTKKIIKKVKSNGDTDEGGKQIGLQRFEVSSTIGNSTFPHRTLKIKYKVWNYDGTKFTNRIGGTITAVNRPIAETYVEVIPDVALQCP